MAIKTVGMAPKVAKSRNNSAYSYVLAGLLVICAMLCISIYLHEVAHQRMNEYYGIESHIEFSFPNAMVVADTEKMPVSLILAHSINEAIGYQLIPLFLGIMLLQLFQAIILLKKSG